MTVVFAGAALWRKHPQKADDDRKAAGQADQELRSLIEGSPAGILAADVDGRVLWANPVAHEILGFDEESLTGHHVSDYFRPLGTIFRGRLAGSALRSPMECRGFRRNGGEFLAQVCFSTFETTAGPRLGVIFSDSATWRGEEEDKASDSQLPNLVRLSTAVDLHEIRNLSWAGAIFCDNLLNREALRKNQELGLLRDLLGSLAKIAGGELRHNRESEAGRLDSHRVLNELRSIILPLVAAEGIQLDWDVPEHLNPVWAERQGLLQALLNLVRNSSKAMKKGDNKKLRVAVTEHNGWLSIRVQDNGPGISDPDRLFHPCQHGPDISNVGLYVSRALIRSYGGDIRHEPKDEGTCFVVELATEKTMEAIGA